MKKVLSQRNHAICGYQTIGSGYKSSIGISPSTHKVKLTTQCLELVHQGLILAPQGIDLALQGFKLAQKGEN